MSKIRLIQEPAHLGRRNNEDGMIEVRIGKTYYYVKGERLHGEKLTVSTNCPSGKDAYPTYESAQKALRMKSASGRRSKRIYKCQFCGCYHFTTNDGNYLKKTKPYKRERMRIY